MTPLETGAFYQKFMAEACIGNEVLLAYGSWLTSNPVSQASNTFTENQDQWLSVKRTDGTVELMKEALMLEDPAEVMALLEKIEELAYEDAMFVPLCSLPFIWVFQPGIEAENGKIQTWLEPNWAEIWMAK
jgi:hypothetical protein